MFYKSGVDITNDRQMFEFLKNHFEYYTMNSWNHCLSIANNVKIYNLGLSGDCWTALNLLENGEYDIINDMIAEWKHEYPMFEVFFNGRSGGYLVLGNKTSNGHVLPSEIAESEDYDEYKRYCREFYGSVKANRSDLVFYTKLVQDFDKLCDNIRDYCDELSKLSFEIVEMEKSVERFNEQYMDDLYYLGFQSLKCDSKGYVDCSEIRALDSLFEAFLRIAVRPNSPYTVRWTGDSEVYYKNN